MRTLGCMQNRIFSLSFHFFFTQTSVGLIDGACCSIFILDIVCNVCQKIREWWIACAKGVRIYLSCSRTKNFANFSAMANKRAGGWAACAVKHLVSQMIYTYSSAMFIEQQTVLALTFHFLGCLETQKLNIRSKNYSVYMYTLFKTLHN